MKDLGESEIDNASIEELRASYRALLAEARALRERIGARVRETFDERRAQNLKLGGYVPYGFKADNNGKLRGHSPERKMIELILAMRREKRSLRDISSTLAERGFYARCNRPLQPKQIARIIRTHAKKAPK